MEISNVIEIFFSPTKTTKKVIEKIAKGTKYNQSLTIDLTSPKTALSELNEFFDELVILGVPVYGGRVPQVAAHRISKLKGNNTPIIIVTVYGNRDYEHALHELKSIVKKRGFIPIAGAAFIGEHSFSSNEFPIAHSRPDQKDLDIASEFGWKIKRKLDKISTLDSKSSLKVPGSYPYKDHMKTIPVTPVSDEEGCLKCGICSDECPTGAICINGDVSTNVDECIFCFACIKNCPNDARKEESLQTRQIQEWLAINYHKRKEPEIFL